MKLFGNNGSKHQGGSKKINDKKSIKSDASGTAEIDVVAVRAAYEVASADKKTDKIVKKKKKNKLKIVLIVLLVLFAVALAAFAWYRSWAKLPTLEELSPTPSPVVEVTPAVTEPDATAEPTPTATPTPTSGQREGVYTFLAVGTDLVSGSTDTMMVATFDTVENTIDVVSIPRDTLVNVSWGRKAVNTLYSSSGLEGLLEGIEKLTGYPINCYAIVDLDAFERLIDAIGGVYYDVPMDMNYSAPDQNLYIDIAAGYQWLNGEDALKVVRFRSGYVTADIGRIGTQQDFLMAVAEQLLQIGNVTKISEFANIFEECVDTNLSLGNVVAFGEAFLKVDTEDISFSTIPANYNGSIRGGSYCLIYPDEWLEFINENLNPMYEEITMDDIDILEWVNGMAVSTQGTTYSIESFIDYNAYIASLTE